MAVKRRSKSIAQRSSNPARAGNANKNLPSYVARRYDRSKPLHRSIGLAAAPKKWPRPFHGCG